MEDSNSLRWAAFVLKYGPRFAPISLGAAFLFFSMLLVWQGIALGGAIGSLRNVRAAPLALHTNLLTSGWAWTRADFTPTPLTVGSVEVIPGASKMQWIGELTNSNAEWIARALVRFSSDTVVTEGQWVTILPNATQPVIVGNVSAPGSIVQLIVDDVVWQQIDTVAAYARVRESPIHIVSTKASTDAKDPVVVVDIQNSGSLGYRDILLLLRWEEGRRVTGSAVIPIESLDSQAHRLLTVRVDHPIAGYAQYHIDPLVDLTDAMHYFVPQAMDAGR